MEFYFEQGTLNEDEMRRGLKIGMMKHEVFPVFCVSAKQNMGSGRLMGFIDNVAPSAKDALPEHDEKGNEIVHDTQAPTEIFVFKTTYEPNLGRMTFFKVISGELKEGMELLNHQTDQTERLNQLFVVDGHKREMVEKLTTGDIGATLKLKNTNTNQTLSEKSLETDVMPISFPEPRMQVAIETENRNDEEKVVEAIHKMQEEDLTIKLESSRELSQLVLGVQGELHLATIQWNLENMYGLKVSFKAPKIPYRETITSSIDTTYRHKKQSGGAGQFAEVTMKVEPYVEGAPDPTGYHIRERQLIDLEWGGKLEFFNCIVGGSIDARFIPSVVKGLMETLQNGPVIGSYMRDIRVILYDGKMHSVDSNDLSFKLAAQNALRTACASAKPQLMEPIQIVEVRVPENLMGEVMTDLQTRRAIIQGMDTVGNYQVITAKVPLAEMDRYSSSLQSITQGKASFTMKFDEFKSVSGQMQETLHQEHMELSETH
jgi:elongation factor G